MKWSTLGQALERRVLFVTFRASGHLLYAPAHSRCFILGLPIA
jgi:hypothetical protein